MILKIISWVFGIAVFANGVLNLFLGNDPGLGIGFIFLSFIYYPPINTAIKKRFAFSIPPLVKITLGIIIVWITLAVGALAEGYLF